MLDEFDIFPVPTVLEAISECPNDRQVFNVVVALVPVAALNCAEVLPLEPSRVWTTTSNIGDLIGVEADDIEWIVDRVRTGVPPAKEVTVAWAAVESLGAEHMSKISRDEAGRLFYSRNEPLVSVDVSSSVSEFTLHVRILCLFSMENRYRLQ